MTGKREPTNDEDQAFYVAFGQRVRALRDEKKLSLAALAARAGITPRRLAYLEGGLVVSLIPMGTLTAIAAALGVKTFDLFNVEHATNEVAGLLEDLRGEPAEKIQAARMALEAEGGANAGGSAPISRESGKP
ncbi:helix-turn-helix domain-containing protein [Polyangium aurulentum]|uniref:helix-turn-helix domain-containing protein n=1 Tax=Polyangium aurulentum TaxID=2567896 RepID=UPI0010AE10E9|nr:helix-turn-helix domain-containing protein [Polyangium aurulentum]UQA60445.1 helix-turn-helix domain-containing protein [Polyangium aurulentum]